MAYPKTAAWNQNTGSPQDIATYDSGWTTMEGTIIVPTGNLGVFVGTSGTYNTARRNDEAASASQYSQIVVTAGQISNGWYCGPMVRGQSGANSSYHVETQGSSFYVSKCLAGTQSTLAGPISQTWAAGDLIRLQVTDDGATVTLKVYRALAASPTSFSQVGSDYTDSSSPILTAGYPGVFMYGNDASNGGGAWEGGNLAGAATITQDSFRFRNEDGSETTATWTAAQNASIQKALDTALRVRYLLDATGDPATKQFRLDYKLNSNSTYVPLLTAAPAAPDAPAFGTAAEGTTNASPAWPSHQLGDIGILLVESCGGEAANLGTASGFAAIDQSPQATGTTTNGTRITAYWCRATSGAMAAPTVTDPGNHVYAIICRVRGCIAEGSPFSGTPVGSVKASASGSVTVTGMNTADANCRVFHCVARDTDSATAAFSSPSGGNLSGINEDHDAGTIQGNGGGLGVYSGTLAAAGATGNLALTVSSSINAFLTFALRPQSVPLLIEPSANITAGGEATTAQLAPPAGKTTGDFVTGRMWDNENGTDSIDIGSGQYTEVEWCLKALAANGAAYGQVYNLRVSALGTALDAYTQSSTLTLGTFSAPMPGMRRARMRRLLHH